MVVGEDMYELERMFSGSEETDLEIALRICSENEDIFRMVLVELALLKGEKGYFFDRFIWASGDYVTQAMLLEAQWERRHDA